MLKESFNYLIDDSDRARKALIGTVLVFLSPLIIPAFILAGYTLRAIRNASKGEKLPVFEDYIGLLVDGLKFTAVMLIYFTGFIVLMLATSLAGSLNEYLGLVFFWILAPLYFGFMLAQPSIAYYFSRELSIKDGLDVKNIVKSCLNFQYVKVLGSLFLIYLAFTIGQILLALTVIGILLIPTTLFYELTVYSRIISEIE